MVRYFLSLACFVFIVALNLLNSFPVFAALKTVAMPISVAESLLPRRCLQSLPFLKILFSKSVIDFNLISVVLTYLLFDTIEAVRSLNNRTAINSSIKTKQVIE